MGTPAYNRLTLSFPVSGSTSSQAPAPGEQVQHHGQGFWHQGKKDAEALTLSNSPVSAGPAVLSAWWTPAWNLTFSTTRQTCPGWRCGCACGSLRCPRGQSSLSPSHPRPSTSCPCLAAWPGESAPLVVLTAASAQLSPEPPSPSRLPA